MMKKNGITISLDESYIKWMSEIPERTQLLIEEQYPAIRRRTKKVVQEHLTPKLGVDEGIYRKSFIINNFAESKWQIGFQVFAKKPHYRLTHLLEDGHRIKLFTWGRGDMTKWGNIGMSFVKTRFRPSGYTREVKHILPGQEYADKQVPLMYRRSYTKIMLERMKKK